MTQTATARPVIRAAGVRRTYGRGADAFEAVRGIDLDVAAGEIFALLGTNGAGKTSTLDLLEGLASPTAGSVEVFGLDPRRDRARVRPETGIVLQSGGLPAELTVAETLTMWRGTCMHPRTVDDVLGRVDLSDRAGVRVGSLCGGEKRRVDLACALLGQPRLLFLDSRVTLQVTLVGVAAVMAVSAGEPVALVGLLAAALAAAAVLEVQPGLTSRPAERWRRPLLVVAVAVPALIWSAGAAVANASDTEALERAATVTAVFAVLTLTMSVLAFTPHRWWWLTGLGLLTGAVFVTGLLQRATFAALVVGVGVLVLGSMVVTLATVRIVDDLERARGLEARLRVADERLRFARDLHDVVGRGFSAVAVKSELAATLARAGATDRAAAEMDEVKALAGCDLAVEGDPARLPAEVVDLAAWATREGTTNIVRHTAATTAVLAFGPTGMSLRNDGVQGEQHERSGLRGLAERAEHVGAALRTSRTEEEFVLEIVWSPR